MMEKRSASPPGSLSSSTGEGENDETTGEPVNDETTGERKKPVRGRNSTSPLSSRTGEGLGVRQRRLIAYSDGASRGNPGPASIGGLVLDQAGNQLATISRRIGRGTNNEAEYRAAIAAVEAALALGASEVELRMDSELVVLQFNGRYRVRNPRLVPHHQRLLSLKSRLRRLDLVHVPRASNAAADRLANAALDHPLP